MCKFQIKKDSSGIFLEPLNNYRVKIKFLGIWDLGILIKSPDGINLIVSYYQFFAHSPHSFV